MDYIKEAFIKVKNDIDFLNKEIIDLKKEFSKTREQMIEICDIMKKIYQDKKPTDNSNISTNNLDRQTNNLPFIPLKVEKKVLSIGNEGVPTDKQTNPPTNQQINISSTNFSPESFNKTIKSPSDSDFSNALGILESLDNIKKGIRLKFKKLTDQEFLVFSTLYQLSEEKGYSDYKTISNKLNLSESSIREYIGKLIKKDIPIEKIKINNKAVNLKISQNLKKITSLNTILKLREL